MLLAVRHRTFHVHVSLILSYLPHYLCTCNSESCTQQHDQHFSLCMVWKYRWKGWGILTKSWRKLYNKNNHVTLLTCCVERGWTPIDQRVDIAQSIQFIRRREHCCSHMPCVWEHTGQHYAQRHEIRVEPFIKRSKAVHVDVAIKYLRAF